MPSSSENRTRDRERRDSSLGSVVWSDLRGSDLTANLERDLRDLYRFYLDNDARERLAGMGRITRAFWISGWLLKSLLLKLSPSRRFMLLVAMVFAILGWTSMTWGEVSLQFDFRPWGFLILLFVLMLELKDKLLAKDEIRVARQVQEALLPTSRPDIPGWDVWSTSVPANDVGGDLVDYIELDAERHGIALGDVSGKGLGAALLSARLQATLRAIGAEMPSLDELGARVNDVLLRDGIDNRFATLFYLELSHESGHVRYLNAGHNAPILLRCEDGSIEPLDPSSRPLGMLPGSGYSEDAVDFAPGDVLLIYSDGLSEAMDVSGEEYGTERFTELLVDACDLALPDIGERILRDVERFLDGDRPHDDLSIVILRRTDDVED